MALKIGKREKIVGGVIVGVAAIAAVHFLAFQGPAAMLKKMHDEYEAKKGEAANIQVMPPDKVIKEFEKETLEGEKTLWRAVFDLNVEPDLNYESIDPPPPAVLAFKADPQSVSDPKVRENYDAALKDYETRVKGKQTAVENLIVAHLQRLLKMKAAFEAGQPWDDPLLNTENLSTTTLYAQEKGTTSSLAVKADATSPSLAATTSSLAGEPASGGKLTPMKLSFLEATPTGWNLPYKLQDIYQQQPTKLWDEIVNLYESWEVLRSLSDSSPTEALARARTDYQTRINNIGLNNAPYQTIASESCKELPAFIRLMLTNLIWSQHPANRIVLGQKTELTLALLKEMLEIKMPAFDKLRHFERQLSMLGILLPLARKDGVEDILFVKCLPPLSIMDPVKAVSLPKGATPTPVPKPKLGLALLQFQFDASNASALRFMYDMVERPEYFRVEDMRFEPVPRQEKIRVTVTVESMFYVRGVSGLTEGLYDPQTNSFVTINDPKRPLWKPYWAAHLAPNTPFSINKDDITSRAYGSVGYNPLSKPVVASVAATPVVPGGARPSAPPPAAAGGGKKGPGMDE